MIDLYDRQGGQIAWVLQSHSYWLICFLYSTKSLRLFAFLWTTDREIPRVCDSFWYKNCLGIFVHTKFVLRIRTSKMIHFVFYFDFRTFSAFQMSWISFGESQRNKIFIFGFFSFERHSIEVNCVYWSWFDDSDDALIADLDLKFDCTIICTTQRSQQEIDSDRSSYSEAVDDYCVSSDSRRIKKC